jgi:hypothetical protein
MTFRFEQNIKIKSVQMILQIIASHTYTNYYLSGKRIL